MEHDAGSAARRIEAAAASEFQIVIDWNALDPANAAAIRTFWLTEGAFGDGRDAAKRLPQVVMHARTAAGEVAGVCTAMAVRPPPLGQPVYYWRAFVGSAWRSTKLVRTLLNRSCAFLAEYAKANGYPCIGILIELQNGRFDEVLRRPVWSNPDFAYLGRTASGSELRIHYFPDVQLK